MKNYISAFAALALLFACTPEENNPFGNEEGGGDKTVHVTGISLDRTDATIKEGESVTLVATVTPENAANKAVNWSSGSDAVATVDASGKVTGVKAGSVTITATAVDGGMKATCALTVEANHALSVTVDANHISAVSAVLAGKANPGSTVGSDLKVGFQYSKSADILASNSTTIEATDADAAYNYTATITGLEPATKYYFRSFARQNGQDTYGETKPFTTKELSSLLATQDATEVEPKSAKLNAKLDLTDVRYKGLAYGFFWGASESALSTDVKCTEIKDNSISASLTNLSHKTQYWYKAYVQMDSQTFYGEVKTFTTDVVPVESVSLDKTEHTFNTIGNTLTLTPTVLPADATDKSVEWTSSDDNVATVTTNGVVKAVGNGPATITVTTKDQGKTATCAITVAQYVTSISFDKTALSLPEGAESTLTATVNPDNAADKTLKWTSSNESVATVDQTGKVTAKAKGNTTITATANDESGVFASCPVEVFDVPLAVDMDTVVNGKNIKWASFNLGASSPEEYGLYYAWGETTPKHNYSWSTYKLCNGSYNTLIKYNNISSYGTVVDNKTVLESGDDAAHAALGGKWRMPTDEEWTALRKQCTWTWTTRNGKNGRLVTASNGNSIFLPAAGYRRESSLYSAGSGGFYWSSSLDTDDPEDAWDVYFNSANVFRYGDDLRYFGLSVRPVSE